MKDSKGRPYVYIDSGDLDFRDIDGPELPQGIIVCYSCLGNGKRRQSYCDAPTMTGRCDSCNGSGFMYEATCKAVPTSVTNQIAGMNGLEQSMPWQAVSMYGLRWKRSPALPRPNGETP